MTITEAKKLSLEMECPVPCAFVLSFGDPVFTSIPPGPSVCCISHAHRLIL